MISVQHQPWSVKLLWFVLPAVGAAALWWMVVARTLRGQVAFSTADLLTLSTFIVFGVFAFGLWLGSLGLMSYLAPRALIRLLASVVATLPMLFFFPFAGWTMLAAGLTCLALWWGLERMRGDLENRLHVRPHLTLGAAFGVVVALLMAAVSLLYYQQLRGSEQAPAELAKRLSSQTVQLAERFMPVLYKSYRPGMTVDHFINENFPTAEQILKDVNFDNLSDLNRQESAIRELLAQRGLDPNAFDVDDQATKAQILAAIDQQLVAQRQQALAEARKALGDQFDITIDGQEPIRDVLTKIVNRQFDRYAGRFVNIIPWLLAAALFFLLRIFNSLFIFSVTWIGWLLYRLYRALHLVKVEPEMVPAEKLEWGH